MTSEITYPIPTWNRGSELIDNTQSIFGISDADSNRDKPIGWARELEVAPILGADYQSAMNVFARYVADAGYKTDFSRLNANGRLLSPTIPRLNNLWGSQTSELLTQTPYELQMILADSRTEWVREIAKDPGNFTFSRLFEARLTQHHTDYAKGNNTLIHILARNVNVRLQELCDAYGFVYGHRPLMNLSLQNYTSAIAQAPAGFINPESLWGAGFAAGKPLLDTLGYRHSDLWFPRLTGRTPEAYRDEFFTYQRNHFEFHRWDHIHAYSVAYNPMHEVVVATHPKIIRPNFVFERDCGLITQYAESERYNLMPLDQYSIHDSIVSSFDDAPDVHEKRDEAIKGAHEIGLWLLILNQLMTIACSTVKTGKGSVKPKLSVTPANRTASMLTVALASTLLGMES